MRHHIHVVRGALLILALQAAWPAQSQNDYVYAARLEVNALRQGEVVASGIRWECKADYCGTRGPWPVPGVTACAALAQAVGPIRAYGHAKAQLTAEQLAECNAGIKRAAGPAVVSAPAVPKLRAGGSLGGLPPPPVVPEPRVSAAPPVPVFSPRACTSDAHCDDGVFCNGREQCLGGRCVAAQDGPCPMSAGPLPWRVCHEKSRSCTTICDFNPDADRDGWDSADCRGGQDCDDLSPWVNPGRQEVCDPDMVDEDCNPNTVSRGAWGEGDADDDGEIDASCCNARPGLPPICGRDCDDHNRRRNQRLLEVCDGIDNDCDGIVDNDVIVAGFEDLDHDMVGGRRLNACWGQEGFVTEGGDCDDNNRKRSPLLLEVCDGIDNDCDGTVDEDTAVCPASGR